MKNILKLLIVSVMLISFTSFSYQANAKDFNPKSYTGEELFRGVFFGYGEVGKQFPEIREYIKFENQEQEQKFLEAINMLENEFKKKDQKYFKDFKKVITSGDRLKIKEKFDQINSDFKEIAKEHNNNSNPGPSIIKPGFVVGLAYAYIAVTHIGGALALVVVVAGVKIYVGGFAPDSNTTEGLTQEKYIDLIAKRLAVK